jgi:hypothetical protein
MTLDNEDRAIVDAIRADLTADEIKYRRESSTLALGYLVKAHSALAHPDADLSELDELIENVKAARGYYAAAERQQ